MRARRTSAVVMASVIGALLAAIAVKPSEVLAIFGFGEEQELAPLVPVPDEYKGKQMPAG
jgi:hypothetical protein